MQTEIINNYTNDYYNIIYLAIGYTIYYEILVPYVYKKINLDITLRGLIKNMFEKKDD